MADKNKMVDFPQYNPDERVPFPPPDPGAVTQRAREACAAEFDTQGLNTYAVAPDDARGENALENAQKKPEEAKEKPFYERYDPDPSAPDPSQTRPGEPDIRDPETRLPEGFDLQSLSPDVDLKE